MTENKMQVFNINLPRGAGLSSTHCCTGRGGYVQFLSVSSTSDSNVELRFIKIVRKRKQVTVSSQHAIRTIIGSPRAVSINYLLKSKRKIKYNISYVL